MKTFADRLIEIISSEYDPSKIHKLRLVVPSERAKWQISKSISENIKTPIILPKIETIHNFILDHSSIKLVDNFQAQLILCKIAESIDSSTPTENFYNKSSIILKEFNDLESYMIDHNKIFCELSNINNIEKWSFKSENLSNNQQKFKSQYQKLGDLFKHFKNTLIEDNKGIKGMIYRNAAENISKNSKRKENIYFIGLNALSKSEEEIIKFYVKENKAKTFVDVDEYYVNNKNHEAGYFYRKHKYLNYNKPVNYISKTKKEITIHESNTSAFQIEIINHIVNNNKDFTIVTMDESLGPIIFEYLIKNHKNINFSSGIQINYFESIKLFSFLSEDFIEGINQSKEIEYPLLKKMLNFKSIRDNILNIEELERKIKKSQLFKIKFPEIKWVDKKFQDLINRTINFNVQQKQDHFAIIQKIIDSVKKLFEKEFNENKALDIAQRELNKIKGDCIHYKYELKHHQILSTLNQQIKKIKVPIKGNKDAKIQILGLLESRTIDVKNIIYVSCNEDFLPKKDINLNLIPNDLKNHYGLPSKYEKEALFAYYFYRNFQFANNIHLIKIKENNQGIKFSEPSRYLKQVEVELKKNSLLKINHEKYGATIKNIPNCVTNNKSSNQRILEWMKSGISPSSIIEFTNCSLSFYYRYVLKIKEDNKPEKFLQPSEWGTGIHKTLEKLYVKNDVIDIEKIKKMINDLDKLMDNEFNLIFYDKRHLKGKNAIVFYHYKKCISNFLKSEIKTINKKGSFKILNLEKEIFVDEKIEIGKDQKEIKFKGIIDRVDSTSEGIRLIDYKSGLVKPPDLNIINFNQIEKKSKALQLLFYAMLFMKKENYCDPLFAQIVSLKNTSQHSIDLKINQQNMISEKHIELFKSWLLEIISTINDQNMLFKHNNESKYCKLC